MTTQTAFDWHRALKHGLRLAEDNIRDYPEAEAWAVMWELLREAARVSEASEPPPHTGYPAKASWPDFQDDVTHWHMQAAYLRGELDELPVEEPTAPVPTAQDVTRADAVLDLWHRRALIVGGRPHRHKRAIYRLAAGATLGAVIRMTGLRRHEVLSLRKRAANEMLRAV